MEKNDVELIKSLLEQDDELRQCYEEHQQLERQLDDYNRRLHLSAEQEFERKELQKRKLSGKDRLMQLLDKHRGARATAH
jgi:uncharacterized protein